MPRRLNGFIENMPTKFAGHNGNNNNNNVMSSINNTNTMTMQPTRKLLPTEMEDLINLPGPLTEDAVMRTLQARFNDNKHFVSIFLLFINCVFYPKFMILIN
jgi:hypothetical protein